MIPQHIMWGNYFYNLVSPQLNLSILIGSIILALLFYYLFKRAGAVKAKIIFLYMHIFMLFLPFIFSIFSWKCFMSFYQCSPYLIITLLFSSTILAFLFSFITIPYLYRWAIKSDEIKTGCIKDFIKTQSKELAIKEPRIYAINDAKPFAYSITNINPAIFITVGLCEILSKKEIEAVLFHELYHIKSKSSLWKFSLNTLRILSPLATFITASDAITKEEIDADSFAIKQQGTCKYLNSAKKKIDSYSLSL